MIGPLIVLAVFFYMTFSFRHSIRSAQFIAPLWRGKIAFLAFVCCSVSCLLYLGTVMAALVKGGFRFYDPALLKIYGLGFISAGLGFVLSMCGKGSLRLPVILSSLAMAVMWVLTAATE